MDHWIAVKWFLVSKYEDKNYKCQRKTPQLLRKQKTSFLFLKQKLTVFFFEALGYLLVLFLVLMAFLLLFFLLVYFYCLFDSSCALPSFKF